MLASTLEESVPSWLIWLLIAVESWSKAALLLSAEALRPVPVVLGAAGAEGWGEGDAVIVGTGVVIATGAFVERPYITQATMIIMTRMTMAIPVLAVFDIKVA